MKAYWGDNVQLHTIPSALGGGEYPARWQEEACSTHQIGGWSNLRTRCCIEQQFCVCTAVNLLSYK
jgi:hypothetical protein